MKQPTKTCATCANYIKPDPRSSTQFEPYCALGIRHYGWSEGQVSELTVTILPPTFGCNRWEKRK